MSDKELIETIKKIKVNCYKIKYSIMKIGANCSYFLVKNKKSL